MELDIIRDAFERAAKKQKFSSSKIQQVIDQVSQEIVQAVVNIQSTDDSSNLKPILSDLKAKLIVLSTHNQLEELQKGLSISLGKYVNTLEKLFVPDISKACRNIDYDPHVVNQIILNHLYREGLLDIADCLVSESSEPESLYLRFQFIELRQILESMQSRNLEPALKWVTSNREKLKQVGSKLELKLHRVQFLQILHNKGKIDALRYARIYLTPIASLNMDEFQKLMGYLVLARNHDRSPYFEFLTPTHWGNLMEEVSKQFCSFLGQSNLCPLNLVVSAGAEGLPTLLKLANLMAGMKNEWQTMKQLPVPVELGKQFQFHSIFVCPVSRVQSSDNNPPMLLPCGHAICEQSITKLSKNKTRSFKCPYCPRKAVFSKCRPLFL